jgi:hypothetical protein
VVSRSYSLRQVQEASSAYVKVAERSVKQNEQLINFICEARARCSSVPHNPCPVAIFAVGLLPHDTRVISPNTHHTHVYAAPGVSRVGLFSFFFFTFVER